MTSLQFGFTHFASVLKAASATHIRRRKNFHFLNTDSYLFSTVRQCISVISLIAISLIAMSAANAAGEGALTSKITNEIHWPDRDWWLIENLYASEEAAVQGCREVAAMTAAPPGVCTPFGQSYVSVGNVLITVPGSYDGASLKLNDFVFAKMSYCNAADGAVYVDGVCAYPSPPPVERPDKGDGPCSPCVGNPINPGNGNKYQRETDYRSNDNPNGLTISRFYNGNMFSEDIHYPRPFGTRWVGRYDSALKQGTNRQPNSDESSCWKSQADGHGFCVSGPPTSVIPSINPQTISILRPDGKKFYFSKIGTAWVSDLDINDRVTSIFDANGNITGWKYIATSTDEVELYDATGRLLSITARSGLMQNLTYSDGLSNNSNVGRIPANAPVCANVQSGSVLPAGRLMCVTDHWGRQLNYEYDTTGHITKVLDPANQEYIYTYDEYNNLVKVTFPDNRSKSYLYNEPLNLNGGVGCDSSGFSALRLNQLSGIVDENGVRYASWAYTCQGVATSSQHAGGVEKVTVGYGTVDANGERSNIVTHFVGSSAAPATTVSAYQFKRILGQMRSTAISGPCAECGTTASRGYDANANVTSATDFNGTTTTYVYDLTRNLETSRTEAAGTAQARTITTTWHATYRLPLTITEPGRATAFSYDASGNLLQKTVTAGASSRIWRYTYNNVGQVLTMTGPRSDVTTYTYDGQGNVATITDALGHTTQIPSYTAHGKPLTIVDVNGLTTTLQYDARQRLTSKSVGGETTGYVYDGVGQLTSVALPDGSSISYTYDDAHRLTSVADSVGNRIDYTLDFRGNRISEQAKDPAGTLARQTTRVYDALNRLQTVTGAAQ